MDNTDADDTTPRVNEETQPTGLYLITDGKISDDTIVQPVMEMFESVMKRRYELSNEEDALNSVSSNVYTLLNQSLLSFLTFLGALTAAMSGGILKNTYWILYFIILFVTVAFIIVVVLTDTMVRNELKTVRWKLEMLQLTRSSLFKDMEKLERHLDGILVAITTSKLDEELNKAKTKVSIMLKSLDPPHLNEDVYRYMTICGVVSSFFLIICFAWTLSIHKDDSTKLHLRQITNGQHMPT